MAKYTIDEFAALCGMERKKLMAYSTGNRKTRIEIGEDKLIDMASQYNAAFLQKYRADDSPEPATVVVPEPKAAPPPKVYVPGGFTGMPADDKQLERMVAGMSDDEIPDYKLSEKKLKYLDTLKRQREIEKLELDNQKKKGEVIPTAPIEVLVFQMKQTILTHGKQGYTSFLNEIGHKYDISPDDMAAFKGFFVNALNNWIENASKEFDRNLAITLHEYSTRRGVGERE